MNIILGIISALFGSVADTIWKKSVLLSKLPQSLFSVYGPLPGIAIIYCIIYFGNIDFSIFLDIKILIIILLIAIISYSVTFLTINVYKKVKLSELLPYKNLDKIFVVLFGFIIFYGTKNGTSITSFIITLSTIFIIIFFSVDIRKINFSKDILKFFVIKFLQSTITLLVGYVFLSYSTIQYLSVETLMFLSITIIASLLQKNNLKLLLTQKKEFYKYRIGASLISWVGFIVGLYIIETSGVLIATLLSFIGLIFQIFSMKFILKDNPERKQIILAFVVMFMIGIGYYFK